MSATDELRRMLDERGISYINVESIDGSYWGIRWFVGDSISAEWRENEERHELLAVNITPEQAIAATLGDAFTREECEASFVHGYSLGTLPVGSDPQWDENRQTVDEHMAELGWVRERTCRMEWDEDSEGDELYPVGHVTCSACGAWLYAVNTMRFCPECGAKVVSE